MDLQAESKKQMTCPEGLIVLEYAGKRGGNMLKYLAIPMGAVLSAAAQILLKRSSSYANWTKEWILFFLLSCTMYFLSLLVYIYLLRMHPISKVYPLMTLITIVLIISYGSIIGELISLRQSIGLALGAGSIYLLLT